MRRWQAITDREGIYLQSYLFQWRSHWLQKFCRMATLHPAFVKVRHHIDDRIENNLYDETATCNRNTLHQSLQWRTVPPNRKVHREKVEWAGVEKQKPSSAPNPGAAPQCCGPSCKGDSPAWYLHAHHSGNGALVKACIVLQCTVGMSSILHTAMQDPKVRYKHSQLFLSCLQMTGTAPLMTRLWR